MDAFLEKYFQSEEWEKSYTMRTGELRRISGYTGLNFTQILNLPYPFFLLLRRDSWIDSLMRTPDGKEILRNLWRLQQTEADLETVHNYEKAGGI